MVGRRVKPILCVVVLSFALNCINMYNMVKISQIYHMGQWKVHEILIYAPHIFEYLKIPIALCNFSHQRHHIQRERKKHRRLLKVQNDTWVRMRE